MNRFSTLVRSGTISGLCLFAMSGISHAAADTCTWTGGGADNNFSTVANWTGCDGAGLPESGDSLALPTSVDSDALTDSDRVLTNDLASITYNTITVTGSYPGTDTDIYTINGNDVSVSGSIVGSELTSTLRRLILIDTNVAITADNARLELVFITGNLAIGSHPVTIDDINTNGGISGSGNILMQNIGGGGGFGGGCATGTSYPAQPISGDSSLFTGALVIDENVILDVTSRSTDIARHASSITLNDLATISFITDSAQDLTFSTPLIFAASSFINVSQTPANSNCEGYDLARKVIIDGPVTAQDAVSVYLGKANLTLTGAVTGGSYITIEEGISKSYSLTIGDTTTTSNTRTDTYSASNPALFGVYAEENIISIIGAGYTVGGAGTNILGGIVKGLGNTGILSMSAGTVAPGMSPGCLAAGNTTFTGGTFEAELGGTTVCTQYDQLDVTGTVNLGSATILSTLFVNSYTPALGASFTIISNDGVDAVTGSFVGLAEAATFTLSGFTFRINYTGGDGNDVVLTVTSVPAVAPAAPATGAYLAKPSVIIPLLSICGAITYLAYTHKTKNTYRATNIQNNHTTTSK